MSYNALLMLYNESGLRTGRVLIGKLHRVQLIIVVFMATQVWWAPIIFLNKWFLITVLFLFSPFSSRISFPKFDKFVHMFTDWTANRKFGLNVGYKLVRLQFCYHVLIKFKPCICTKKLSYTRLCGPCHGYDAIM